MRDQRIAWPIGGFKIAHHQQLREGIKAKLDCIGVDRPSPLGGNRIGDRIEVTRWPPIFGLCNIGQGEAEIAAQPFLQGLIGGDVVLAKLQIEGRALGIANQGDRKQDQRRVARHAGFFVLVPAQETKGEEEDVDAALLLGGLRGALHPMQPLVQKPGRQRCLQTGLVACPRGDRTRRFRGRRVAPHVRDFLGRENPQRLALANEIREDFIRCIAGEGKRARPLGSPRGMNEPVAGPGFD